MSNTTALIIVSSHVVFKTSEESYRKQKAFITNASHELKTPLTIINTDVEILKMDDVNNEWTDSIEDQVRKLTAMTNQLVTLSKLDEESIKRNSFENLSLTEIANESITAFGPTFEKEGFKFSVDIDEGVAIKGNRNLLNELFYIFLDNAFKYTKPNGEVVLKVKKNKYKIEINFENDIEDTEVDVNQVFERFYRSPHFSKKEGSGIGLSIAKEIVNLHKGKIVASIKDKRINFNIVFWFKVYLSFNSYSKFDSRKSKMFSLLNGEKDYSIPALKYSIFLSKKAMVFLIKYFNKYNSLYR